MRRLSEKLGWGGGNLGNGQKKTFFKDVFLKHNKYSRISLSMPDLFFRLYCSPQLL